MTEGASQFRIQGRVDLDGTHTAILEATNPQFHFPKTETVCMALRSATNPNTCGCIISEIRLGATEDKLIIDRYKLWHLGLKDGDIVDARIFTPPPAKSVTYKPASELTGRDKIRFIGKPVVSGEKSALFTFSGDPRPYTILQTSPQEIVLITPATELKESTIHSSHSPVSYSDIGGLAREIKLIREAVEYPFRYADVFTHLGVTAPKGIILHGPPGTGKTLLAKALATEVGANFYSISGPEIYSKWYGKSEQTLRNIFDEAIKNAPSIVVIDELDALAPRRDSTHGDQEQRIVATFLTQMDGMKELKDVVVVGTTNRLNEIDPALRRGGRFEHEIFVSAADTKGREEILTIHTRRMPLMKDIDLEKIAEATNGFVGADLASLCREAAYVALRRSLPENAFETGDVDAHKEIKVGHGDFMAALKSIPPSAAREYALDVPPVNWDDVGGLDEAKSLLIENLECAVKNKAAFEKVGIRPASGILLFGPPGTGKTLLARAVASQCGANFIAIKGSEIRYKWLGQSEEKIQQLFARAKQLAPSVIFFDEIDTILPMRGRELTGSVDAIVNQILSEMDGIEDYGEVFVMGATNRIDAIDSAALRPGRFDYQLHIPLPNEFSRKSIFNVHLKNKPLDSTVDLEKLAVITNGFNGAQIAEVCREAAWNALRDAKYDAQTVKLTMHHLVNTVERIIQTMERGS